MEENASFRFIRGRAVVIVIIERARMAARGLGGFRGLVSSGQKSLRKEHESLNAETSGVEYVRRKLIVPMTQVSYGGGEALMSLPGFPGWRNWCEEPPFQCCRRKARRDQQSDKTQTAELPIHTVKLFSCLSVECIIRSINI